MPLYEFLCPERHSYELVYNRYEDAPDEIECMACGKPAVRLAGAPAFILKGKGWTKERIVDKPAFEGIKKLEGTDGVNTYHYDKMRQREGRKPWMEVHRG